MPLPVTERAGEYWRLIKPGWSDPNDTSYSKRPNVDNRWNPVGDFGALYLCASITVAAANARWKHNRRAIKLFDLAPSKRYSLVQYDVPVVRVLDAASSEGIRALGFEENFPFGVPHTPCREIAVQANGEGLRGVAARSAAEVTATSHCGEELALFDTHKLPEPQRKRREFADWYPDGIPNP